jgi:hypothetical protein
MNENIKGLLAKCWKDELVDLAPGTHYVDEVLTIHVSGSVQKQADSMVAPTTSLPYLSIIALLLERSGCTKGSSVKLLREVITEAMTNPGKGKNEQIEARMKDVETAVKLVKEELVGKLERQHRDGRLLINGLTIAVLNEQATTPVAA